MASSIPADHAAQPSDPQDPPAGGPASSARRGLVHRRGLLTAASATLVAGAGTSLGAPSAAASTSATSLAAASPRGGFVDVHHHATPPAVRTWLVDHGLLPPAGGPPWATWSPEDALTTMNTNRIQYALLSAIIPPAFFSSPTQQAELARITNDALAALTHT
ncbi:MAG: hypothetical protein IRZ08_22405, partial [Frankia sp.]|nr:hypothetical protein [Frankia sp.]